MAVSDCSSLLLSLFGSETVNPAKVAAACSETIEWFDMTSGVVRGRAEVLKLLEGKFPDGSGLQIERLSDGSQSSGFTWHRVSSSSDLIGLRGTLYAEVDDTGKLCYVQEGSEPLFKPGEATEALLKAVTSGASEEKPQPTYTQATPTTAEGIVRYLWKEAYPKGAGPEEALRLFAEAIRYEDFNYPKPFIGKPAVTDFLNAFDIPGIEFVPQRVSEGARACCFTWLVKVNGADGPSGISFYEVDETGKICFIRDIPASSIKPAPLLALATLKDPALRVFTPRKH